MKSPSRHALFSQVRKHGLWIAAGLMAIVLVDALQLYAPRLIKFAVDGLARGEATRHWLLLLGLAVLALAAATAIFRMLGRPLMMAFGRKVEKEMRLVLYGHLQILDLSFHEDHPPGQLMVRVTYDLSNVRLAAGYGLQAAVDSTLTGLLALGFMISISPLLSAVAALPLLSIPILTRRRSKSFHRAYLDIQKSLAQLTEESREIISYIDIIKAFAVKNKKLAAFSELGRRHLHDNLKLARVQAQYLPLMTMVTQVCLGLVLAVGGSLAILDFITAGDYVAFGIYLAMMKTPLVYAGYLVNLWQRTRASLDRLDEALCQQPGIADPVKAEAFPPPKDADIEFRCLTFRYSDSDHTGLSGLGLKISASTTTALVGPVGSGKSTLLKLLTRLYDPPLDTVLVGGVDVRRFKIFELRTHILYSPQEAMVFSASIGENLRLGKPGAQDQELWSALEASELSAEVDSLPHRLDTLVGERGFNLSGGQRQRLCLARALLTDAPILALDDPLSEVDMDTEMRILKNLGELRRRRTTIIISHRLATVSFADYIFVLDKGVLVEEGRHHDLIQAGGCYERLFAEQALKAAAVT
ncbi:MAG: ABC transporter ATP-binding protein [Desulfarculaceae bacterium]|jgi:ATP-binding cassette subfamily B protein